MKQDIFIQKIEDIAPPQWACSWDCSGLQVASTRNDIHTCLIALDPTLDVVTHAIEIDADMIITHHPIDLAPLSLHKASYYLPYLRKLLQHDIALYSAHTSLDATVHTISGFLADYFALKTRYPIEPTYTSLLYAVNVYSTAPYILEYCKEHAISFYEPQRTPSSILFFIEEAHRSTISSFLTTHQLTYTIEKTEKMLHNVGIGCIGQCATPLTQDDIIRILQEKCNVQCIGIHGTLPDVIHYIAYCPGAGSSLIKKLSSLPLPVDLYITGEIKHHDAVYSPFPLMEVGHFSLEESMMHVFYEKLQIECPDVTFHFYTSTPPFRYITA